MEENNFEDLFDQIISNLREINALLDELINGTK